jgi:hypothetical protein
MPLTDIAFLRKHWRAEDVAKFEEWLERVKAPLAAIKPPPMRDAEGRKMWVYADVQPHHPTDESQS